jgi:hypothetical protein
MTVNKALLEKTLDDDGMFELRLNDHLLFRAADNNTIKVVGQTLISLADDELENCSIVLS